MATRFVTMTCLAAIDEFNGSLTEEKVNEIVNFEGTDKVRLYKIMSFKISIFF